MDATGKIVAVIIIICLIFICYKCTKQIYGYHTEATVIKSKRKNENKYLLNIKYTIDNKEYINKIISKKEKSKDDKISIIYDKFDPNEIEMDYSGLLIHDKSGGGYGVLIWGICIMLAPFFIIVLIMKFYEILME